MTARQKQGRLIIISAPSGAGKTTVVERVLAECPDLKRSVSYTTRKPRAGEVKGKDYHFVSKRNFLFKRRNKFFLEWAEVFGEFYGTAKQACLDWMSKGRDVILTIDVQGMRKIKARLGKRAPLMTVFMMPPSRAVLRKRLHKRKTDSEAEIEKRLRMSETEMRARREYDHVMVNRTVAQAAENLKRLLYKNR